MTIFGFFTLLGGLAMFLYGMQIMGEALEHRAGSRLKPILENLTSSPLKGVLVGTVVTGIIQSSSATTVMLVSFVNSGIMQLRQAISVVFGANIGTTITAWILSLAGIESNNFWVSLLKPSTFSPILAFVGILMIFISKRKRDTAEILLGFAILMFGMEMMASSVKGLADVPEFVGLLTLFSNPILGVLVGMVFTMIIQSSSASVGILQAIAMTGVLSFGSAIPILMGLNIGTCITAAIAAIGANRNAKRVAAAHIYFNVAGTVLFLSIFTLISYIFDLKFVTQTISAVQIAIAHTLFNLLSTAVIFPFIKQLEKLTIKTIKDNDKGEEKFEMLDERLLASPYIALERCKQLANEMAKLARDALIKSLSLINIKHSEKEEQAVIDMESKVDVYEDKLGTYLVKISTKKLSEPDSRELSKLLHLIGNLERISDHAVNVALCAQEMSDKKLAFSEFARNEVTVLSAAVTEILTITVDAFVNDDSKLAERVEPLEQVVDSLDMMIKERHIQRLSKGICTIELGFILSDLLTNLERVADHCSNIAVHILDMKGYGDLDAHQYLQDIKSGRLGDAFSKMYDGYLEKYSLAAQSGA